MQGEAHVSASRTRASANRIRAIVRFLSTRDFSKRILIDSLVTDFAQLEGGSFSSSVVRVLQVWFVFWSAIRVFQVWFILLESLSCENEYTVCLYDMPPFVIASSSVSNREFEREYSRFRVLASSSLSTHEFEREYSPVRVQVLASFRASIHTRKLAHTCALLSLTCLALARLQYSCVALCVTRVTCTRC